MKALSRLQSTVMFQAVEVEEVAAKMNGRAKTMVSFGVLVAAALAAQGAQAQQGPMSPSNCAAVGATVGGLAGSQIGNSNTKHAIGAALGALGAGAAGYWLCSPKPARSQDASYASAANYGQASGNGNGSGSGNDTGIERQEPKAPLSYSERERLDQMSKEAIDAKWVWKKALWEVDRAGQRNFAPGVQSAKEREAEARQNFEEKRAVFATTVARLNNGFEGSPPRAVGRYIEVSASLLELTTESRVTYQMLEARDRQMQERSPAYHEEANRAARLRGPGGSRT